MIRMISMRFSQAAKRLRKLESYAVPVKSLIAKNVQFAYSGEGISHSEKQGVHQVQFHGSPGLVLLLYATDTGNKNLQYDTTSEAINSSGTDYSRWTSIYWEFFTTAAFALLSIPILKRIFK